jgi:hypothetical protein
MQHTKLTTCIDDGNKQLTYFLFILLFIHFTIILPSKRSPKNYEIIGTSASVANQLQLIDRQISVFENRRDTTHSSEALDYLDDKINQLQSQKIQFQKDQIELAKQKVIDRNFSVPVLNVSISESIIRTIYPGFLLVGLCILLGKRKKFIDLYAGLNEVEKRDVDLPIWTSPIPMALSNEKLSIWLLKNIFGLSVHFLLLYTALDFILTELKGEFSSFQSLFQDNEGKNFEVLTIDLLLVAAAAVCYLSTIIHTVKIEWKKR